MGKMNFRFVGFEQPQGYAKKKQERINEIKNAIGKRGYYQWRMNRSTRNPRYLHAQTHKTSKNRHANLFFGHFYKFHIFGHKVFDFRMNKVERYEIIDILSIRILDLKIHLS